ncbi:hypothetical protein ACFRNJ_17300 [Streptomyces sp. NPDC056721]|uniref:hypothetical protein n=1 Tax=Streptomyces sp. NPDC056721 TaxID=3345923 RepID=UPI00368E7472
MTTSKEKKIFLYYPNSACADCKVIRVCDRDGLDHAVLIWNVCQDCRCGMIAKISITDEWQRQGLGRRLLLWALRESPGCDWVTSGQSPEAQLFFPVMARETGAAFTNRGKSCGHLEVGKRSYPQPRVLTDI